MTWRFSTLLAPELVPALESRFLEEDFSPWMLQQNDPVDPWYLSGYFSTREEGEAAWEEISGEFPILETPEREEIPDTEWQNQYQQFLQPWHYGDLHWIPRWMERDHPTDQYGKETVLFLEAGMAFGTGTHETTQLCGQFLVDELKALGSSLGDLSVVDAGCGSGILALTAVSYGVDKVLAFDTDPDALLVAEENERHNHLGGRILWKHGGLDQHLEDSAADILLANIQADVLQRNADILICAVKPGGSLILSGILEKEHEAVVEYYQKRLVALGLPANFTIKHSGDWTGVHLKYSE